MTFNPENFTTYNLDDDMLLEELKSFFRGKSINQHFGEEYNYFNALHACCYYHQEKSILWLLKHGAEVNSISGNGNTPLAFFAQNQFYEESDQYRILNILEQYKADYNISSDDKLPIEHLLHYRKYIEEDILLHFLEHTHVQLENKDTYFDPAVSFIFFLSEENHNTNSQLQRTHNLTFNIWDKLFEKKNYDINYLHKDMDNNTITYEYRNFLNAISDIEGEQFEKIKPHLDYIINKKSLNFQQPYEGKSLLEQSIMNHNMEFTIYLLENKHFSYIEALEQSIKHNYVAPVKFILKHKLVSLEESLKHLEQYGNEVTHYIQKRNSSYLNKKFKQELSTTDKTIRKNKI